MQADLLFRSLVTSFLQCKRTVVCVEFTFFLLFNVEFSTENVFPCMAVKILPRSEFFSYLVVDTSTQDNFDLLPVVYRIV